MAKVIKVGKKDSQYDVHIFNKNINKASLIRALKNNNKVLIITDSGIPKRYLNISAKKIHSKKIGESGISSCGNEVFIMDDSF